MDKYKITQNEINENNVKSAADLLKGEPRDNKNIFDRLPELIAGKVNGFIDAVISKFADYYNKSEIDGKETALSDRINAKANSADVYAKSETYTKAETNDAIAQKVVDIEAGDMAKAVYDTDNDGVVDNAENAENAEKLNGQPASYYATKTEVETAQATADNAIASLNKLGIKLLWFNDKPTQNFGPQSIIVDNLSSYEAIDIAFDVVAGGAGWDIVTARIYKDWNVEISVKGTIWDSASYTYSRGITVDWENNKITFAKATMGSNTYENRMIPYTVHGIK